MLRRLSFVNSFPLHPFALLSANHPTIINSTNCNGRTSSARVFMSLRQSTVLFHSSSASLSSPSLSASPDTVNIINLFTGFPRVVGGEGEEKGDSSDAHAHKVQGDSATPSLSPLATSVYEKEAPAAAATVPVDIAVVEKAIERVLIDPQQRILQCKKALEAIQRDSAYIAAQAWEKKALQKAEKYPFRLLWGVFGALLVQNVILTYWVFVAFDWNLVEPCTYFFGYTSLTWFALVFYKFTGKEFTYDALIEELKRRKFSDLAGKAETQSQYMSVLKEFRLKEAVLKRELEALGAPL